MQRTGIFASKAKRGSVVRRTFCSLALRFSEINPQSNLRVKAAASVVFILTLAFQEINPRSNFQFKR
jgi:hypothetical protein